MRARHLPFVLLGLGLAATQVAAAPLDTTGASQCEVRGFATDTDPKGTNVRTAPRADAAIIGRLPPLKDSMGVELDITGSKDGWLLARSEDGKLYGWVSGKLVSFTLGMRALRTAPRRDAPLVMDLQGSDWGPSSVGVSAVHACQGKYVDVTVRLLNGKTVRGWSWSPCATQLTTCDRGGMVE